MVSFTKKYFGFVFVPVCISFSILKLRTWFRWNDKVTFAQFKMVERVQASIHQRAANVSHVKNSGNSA